MIEMTLFSRHRIRNSRSGGLRSSTLPLGHGGSPQYWLSHVDGEETFFVSFKPTRQGTEPGTLAWKAAVLTTTLGPPPANTVVEAMLGKWCVNAGPQSVMLAQHWNSIIWVILIPNYFSGGVLMLFYDGPTFDQHCITTLFSPSYLI